MNVIFPETRWPHRSGWHTRQTRYVAEGVLVPYFAEQFLALRLEDVHGLGRG